MHCSYCAFISLCADSILFFSLFYLLLLSCSLPAAVLPVSCRLSAASRGRVRGEAAASWFEQVYSPCAPIGPLCALGCRPETDG